MIGADLEPNKKQGLSWSGLSMARRTMRRTSLRLRYLLTVLLVGVGLTMGVAVTLTVAGGDADSFLPTVVASGLVLTLVAAAIAWRMMARIDAAMRALIESSDRIGRASCRERV